MEIEHFFTCPYCWQEISFILDPSVAEQSYVEDCEVCCRPIRVECTADGEEILDFNASALDD
mgnify:FL=1